MATLVDADRQGSLQVRAFEVVDYAAELPTTVRGFRFSRFDLTHCTYLGSDER